MTKLPKSVEKIAKEKVLKILEEEYQLLPKTISLADKANNAKYELLRKLAEVIKQLK